MSWHCLSAKHSVQLHVSRFRTLYKLFMNVQRPVFTANRAKSAAKKEAARKDKVDSLGGGGSRLTQIKEWLQGSKGDGEDALIIFDECHVSGGSGGRGLQVV